jgi:hypothetical protein
MCYVTLGDFKNGLRHGKGTFYENNKSRKYEGMWSMSMKEGDMSGAVHMFKMISCVCAGNGMESFGNGDFYTGEFSRDKFHGNGELISAGGRYVGEFRYGIKDGFGKMVFKNGCKYEGKWKAGRFDGKGLYVWTGSVLWRILCAL